MKLDEYGQVVERELRFTMEIIRGHDFGDFCDGLWANPASQDRAGAPSGLSPSVSSKAAHRISRDAA